jgi:signal transduction histidine kinase
MRDRITLLGGTMTVETGSDGSGVTIRAELPITEHASNTHDAHREDIEHHL